MPVRSIKQLNPPPTDWLWPGYLAAGCIAILDGDPGQGKSMLTLDLAARLTTARPWPDGAAARGQGRSSCSVRKTATPLSATA